MMHSDYSQGGPTASTQQEDVPIDPQTGKPMFDNRIFVALLASRTTNEGFISYFSQFGAVKEAFIVINKVTHLPRGFGFVEFHDAAVRDYVLTLDHVLDGRKLELKRAQPRDNPYSTGGIGGGATQALPSFGATTSTASTTTISRDNSTISSGLQSRDSSVAAVPAAAAAAGQRPGAARVLVPAGSVEAAEAAHAAQQDPHAHAYAHAAAQGQAQAAPGAAGPYDPRMAAAYRPGVPGALPPAYVVPPYGYPPYPYAPYGMPPGMPQGMPPRGYPAAHPGARGPMPVPYGAPPGAYPAPGHGMPGYPAYPGYDPVAMQGYPYPPYMPPPGAQGMPAPGAPGMAAPGHYPGHYPMMPYYGHPGHPGMPMGPDGMPAGGVPPGAVPQAGMPGATDPYGMPIPAPLGQEGSRSHSGGHEAHSQAAAAQGPAPVAAPRIAAGPPRIAAGPPSSSPATAAAGSSSAGTPGVEKAGPVAILVGGRPLAMDQRKVFVGGIPPSVSEADFRSYFSRYGNLVDCVVMVDRDTGRSRGFGFVTYDTEAGAHAVLAEKHMLHGRVVDCKLAQPREENILAATGGKEDILSVRPDGTTSGVQPGQAGAHANWGFAAAGGPGGSTGHNPFAMRAPLQGSGYPGRAPGTQADAAAKQHASLFPSSPTAYIPPPLRGSGGAGGGMAGGTVAGAAAQPDGQDEASLGQNFSAQSFGAQHYGAEGEHEPYDYARSLGLSTGLGTADNTSQDLAAAIQNMHLHLGYDQ